LRIKEKETRLTLQEHDDDDDDDYDDYDDDYDDDDDEKTFHKISCTKRQNQIPIIGSRVGIFVQTDERTGRHNRRTARLQT